MNQTGRPVGSWQLGSEGFGAGGKNHGIWCWEDDSLRSWGRKGYGLGIHGKFYPTLVAQRATCCVTNENVCYDTVLSSPTLT